MDKYISIYDDSRNELVEIQRDTHKMRFNNGENK